MSLALAQKIRPAAESIVTPSGLSTLAPVVDRSLPPPPSSEADENLPAHTVRPVQPASRRRRGHRRPTQRTPYRTPRHPRDQQTQSRSTAVLYLPLDLAVHLHPTGLGNHRDGARLIAAAQARASSVLHAAAFPQKQAPRGARPTPAPRTRTSTPGRRADEASFAMAKRASAASKEAADPHNGLGKAHVSQSLLPNGVTQAQISDGSRARTKGPVWEPINYAGERTRTSKGFGPPAPKAGVSTSSTTPAGSREATAPTGPRQLVSSAVMSAMPESEQRLTS